MTELTAGHTVKRFDNEMRKLHDYVLDMGERVKKQILDAVKALDDEDPIAAREVIRRDRDINQLDVEIDEEIIRLIAKRQPMAKDLREILAIGKIVTDLERVGDQARKIARLVIQLYDHEGPPPNSQLLRDIPHMAAFCHEMVTNSLRAFDTLNLELAVETIKQDKELGEEFKAGLRRLSTYLMEDARSVGHVVEVVLGLRALERIGGHAKNIGGYVVFLITGRDVRHESLKAIMTEVLGQQ